MRHRLALASLLATAGLTSCVAAQPTTQTAEAPSTQPSTSPSTQPSDATMPGVKQDRVAGHVDVDAVVATREGDWMELLACGPGTLEYESILSLRSKPSHVHLALLTLGLEPGKPLTYDETDDGYVVNPARGPKVAITLLVPQEGGAPKEVPANHWVVDQNTGATMPENVWLFAGSSFAQYEGRSVYMADLNGTAITLVHFGEDMIARSTDLTNRTDNQAWRANTEMIPPVGSPVTIRLRPLGEAGRAPVPREGSAPAVPAQGGGS